MGKTTRKKTAENTLIGDLFWELRANLKVCENMEYFTDRFFPGYNEYMNKATPLFNSREFKKACEDDFSCCLRYIQDENCRIEGESGKKLSEIRKEQIRQFVEECVREDYAAGLKETLLELLDVTTIHSDYVLREKMMSHIEKLPPLKKVENDIEKRWQDQWIQALYYYFHFAVTDKLHSRMAFSEYPELEKDIEEYNNRITMRYGMAGNPGMFQLYSMAEREDPNIIALYQCGELEYYGKGLSGKVSYQKAYEFYEKVRECSAEHPMASYSIAYMKYHYSQEDAAIHPEHRVQEFEEELAGRPKSRIWYGSIINDAMSSYYYGCAAAANFLGKILDDADKNGLSFLRQGPLRNVSSRQLYKESADGGDVFGCNRYGDSLRYEAMACKDPKRQKKLYREAFFYYEKAAALGEPWVTNLLGYYYKKGITIQGEEIWPKDLEKAYQLFEDALIMSDTQQYYWPLINLCETFWLNPENDKYMMLPGEQIEKKLKQALDHVKTQNEKTALEKLLSAVTTLEKDQISKETKTR